MTFALAGNPDGRFPKKRMAVAAAGMSREFALDATGTTRANPGWAVKSWRFTAVDRQTLEFYTLMKSDDACGPIIDDLRVTEGN